MPDLSIQQQLFSAIESGDLASVRALLRAGADVNRASSDPDGQTPLRRAVATMAVHGKLANPLAFWSAARL